jgi:hypothetical protein
MVNAAFLDCVNKAEKQKSQQRPWKKNELNNLKKVFDAASTMTAIVNWLPNKTETYDNFKDMHHSIAKKIASGDEPQQNKVNHDKANKERVLEDAEDDDIDSDHEPTTLHLPDGNDSNDSNDSDNEINDKVKVPMKMTNIVMRMKMRMNKCYQKKIIGKCYLLNLTICQE